MQLLPDWQDQQADWQARLVDWQFQWESLALKGNVLPSGSDQPWCMQLHAHHPSGSNLQTQKQLQPEAAMGGGKMIWGGGGVAGGEGS